jgi:hypothetical protein
MMKDELLASSIIIILLLHRHHDHLIRPGTPSIRSGCHGNPSISSPIAPPPFRWSVSELDIDRGGGRDDKYDGITECSD